MRRSRDYRKPLLYICVILGAALITMMLLFFINSIRQRGPVVIAANLSTPKTYIPVTGFNNYNISNITGAEADDLEIITEPNLDPDDQSVYLISPDDIDYRVRALSLDGKYYFDEHFDEYFTINQTGVTALTRAMLPKLNTVGDGAYFAEKVAEFLSSADITHTSNEVSFHEKCDNSADMAFCADLRMYSALTAIGIDVVELTGNHNNDWGGSANISTIEKYHDDNIQTFGGGADEEQASIPLTISENGTNITWLGINYSTSTKANGQGANGDHPGANIYDAELVAEQIKSAKARGDFVIVDVQYFECYSYPDDGEEMPSCDYPISGQTAFFRNLIDLGADMVVGTQAHQPQTFELYNSHPIYYGLGNLFFDQIIWPGTRRSLVLTHYFANGELVQTKITPTIYNRNYQTEIMSASDAEDFLKRLSAAASNAFYDE